MSDPSSVGPTNRATGIVPAGVVASRRCSAHTTSGKPCGRYAIVGGTVCPTHGGSAPQVIEAARRRIRQFAPMALQVLEDIAQDPDAPEAARVRAAIDLLDRAGLKQAEEHILTARAEDTNAALDDAIAAALAARGLLAGDQGQEPQVLDVEVTEP